MSARLTARLADLKQQNRAGFVPFVMAGDPGQHVTASILSQLPAHGADIIELGMPFSDPMADGPTIQAAGLRALAGHIHLRDILTLVSDFRVQDDETPIILMGYSNPVFHHGIDAFMKDAAKAGVDGLIIVDVPAEEGAPFIRATHAHQLDMIRLIAPTSLSARLPIITQGASGFVYYITIKGITGTASADYTQLAQDIAAIRASTSLPVAAGFGITSPDDVRTVAQHADLVVVGSNIVKEIEKRLDQGDNAIVNAVLSRCRELSQGVR